MLWKVALLFEDRDGNSRRMMIHTSAATDVAALVAFAQGVENAVAPLSNAAIVGGSITHSWRSTRPLPALYDFSDARRKALLLARQNDDSLYASVLIPSPATGGAGTNTAGALGSWRRLPTGATAIRGTHTPRILPRVSVALTHRLAIDALLPVIVRADGSAFPAQDWLYAELSP